MEVELYCCYSLPLRNFLYENGLRYKLAALNPNSQKLFWVYVKDKNQASKKMVEACDFFKGPVQSVEKTTIYRRGK